MADVEVGAVAPVVNEPVAAEVATPEQVTTAEPVETPEPEAKPERTFTQKELDDIVSKRLAKESRRAERIASERIRREMVERENAELRAKLEGPKSQPQGKPDPADPRFGGVWERYNEAFVEWAAEQKLQAHLEKQGQQTEDQRAYHRQVEEARYVRENIVGAGKQRYSDFEDVVLAEDVPITRAQVVAASRLPNGIDVLYHLGQNPEEARRLAPLDAIDLAWEIQKISSKLSAPPVPTKTQAPIVPNGTKATADKDPSKMTDKEFADWRRRQIAQRGNR